MIDRFKNYFSALESPARNLFTITPNDSADLPYMTRAIYVGGDGNLSVVSSANETVVLVAAKGGSIIPVQIKKVNETGTTASSLVGMY